MFSDTTDQNSCLRESQEDQTEEEDLEERGASERETQEDESEVPYISEKSEPKRKGHRHLKIRCNYTFKQTIENLHRGRPAYCSADLNPCERTKSPMRVEIISGGTRELQLPAWNSRRGGSITQSE